MAPCPLKWALADAGNILYTLERSKVYFAQCGGLFKKMKKVRV